MAPLRTFTIPPTLFHSSSFALLSLRLEAEKMNRGACTGSLSWCALGGFALESRCHAGQTILYDTVSELGWSIDIRTHGIVQVIEHILKSDWDATSKSLDAQTFPWGRKKPSDGEEEPDGKKRENRSSSNVPPAKPEEDCVDCVRWEVRP
jgi:lipase ATG15